MSAGNTIRVKRLNAWFGPAHVLHGIDLAIAPYEDWHRQAWAGALVLIALIFLTSLAARLATRRRLQGAR